MLKQALLSVGLVVAFASCPALAQSATQTPPTPSTATPPTATTPTIPATVTPAVDEAPVLVIVIDDIGYSRRLGERAIDLPGNITYAVLPNGTNSVRLATRAFEAGKEVIVHTPMSSVNGGDQEPGALTTALLPGEFLTELNKNIDAVPYAIGLNNHMGSELTTRPEYMRLLMQVVAQRNLYFIDSRTSSRTVAAKMAQRYKIPHLSRDVFLDNDRDPEAIARAYAKLLRIARRKGFAVGIGHPYPSTINFLETALPKLADQGVELIYGSSAIARFYAPPPPVRPRRPPPQSPVDRDDHYPRTN